jgi:hypothetical protein
VPVTYICHLQNLNFAKTLVIKKGILSLPTPWRHIADYRYNCKRRGQVHPVTGQEGPKGD